MMIFIKSQVVTV